jgi:hypothetical protein
MFALSRIVFFMAGIRMDMSALSGRPYTSYWQQLDLVQLHRNLVQSIWYLQSQPPLFNMTTGLIVKLPRQLVTPAAVLVGLVLGLGIALSCYFLCLELHLLSWSAYLVSALVVFDPASAVYQNWFFYAYPTAFAVTFAALSGARYLRGGRPIWGVGFFASLAVVVLLNSSFQWPWLLLASLPVLVVLRRQWRALVLVGLVPVLCVSFWYVKNAVLFHTYTTSSWTGMNLAQITIDQATPKQLNELVKNGTLTPISLIVPFMSPPAAYGHSLSNHGSTGVAVLDRVKKSDGSINLNDVNFVAISNQYLANDIRFIKADPGAYARSVGKAITTFMLPSEQYAFFASNEHHLSGYARAYELIFDGQLLGVDPSTATTNAGDGHGVSALHISWFVVLEYLITFTVIPALAWRRRRDLPYALTLGFITLTTLYIFVVTNLTEFGENNRFRFDVGPLPLIATAVVAMAAVKYVSATAPIAKTTPAGDQPSPSQEVSVSP